MKDILSNQIYLLYRQCGMLNLYNSRLETLTEEDYERIKANIQAISNLLLHIENMLQNP